MMVVELMWENLVGQANAWISIFLFGCLMFTLHALDAVKSI